MKNIHYAGFFLVLAFCASSNSLHGQGVQEAWVAHYSSYLVPSVDNATALAIDASGNVYVAGTSDSSATVCLATIKYDAAGVRLWVARYANGIASAVAVDGSGNVYVTGTSNNSNGSDDFVTIKYNSSGVQQWVSHYIGLGNSIDHPIALSVDAAGNAYVTGSTQDSLGHSSDYLTIKYNAAGVQQWIARYNGTGNSNDAPTALAIDGSGNVYVTGSSTDSSTHHDYATIKYNAGGVRQWVARYNGPGNGDDGATALAIDSSGNIYVTGSSDDSTTFFNTFSEFATIKYNSAEVQQWVKRYMSLGDPSNHATALAVDASGNIIVTGYSGYITGLLDRYFVVDSIITVKYNSTGLVQWGARYKVSFLYATALALDASGNIYVTGSGTDSSGAPDYATIKYSATGVEQWVSRYNGPGKSADYASAIAVDGSGNIYVAGSSNGLGTASDYATIKYNSAGSEQWVSRYNGPGKSNDKATALALDGSGNVYVTGSSDSAGSSDYATVKYDAAGVQQWVARYKHGKPFALALDAANNVYVTGYSYYQQFTVKYNAAGMQQWVTQFNAPNFSNFSYGGTVLGVDPSGDVCVTGGSYSIYPSPPSDDYLTIKYSPAGVEKWNARYGRGLGTSSYSTAMVIDHAGNVYVTGSSKSDTAGGDDYATIKYNASGVQQWVARYPNGRASAITVDTSGNVFVTGTSYSPSTQTDYATIKYNPSGVQQWAARYDGPTNWTDVAKGIAVDDSGNVYVTGWSSSSGTASDFVTIKYNTAGVQQWIARYNATGNFSDLATALALDALGNVYVTGSSSSSGTASDFVTIKYNTAGVQQWIARYSAAGNSSDLAAALALDASGNVYVTGSSSASGTSSVFTTIKYVQTPTSVKETVVGKPGTYRLDQNYPNPFNPTTVIRYQLPVNSLVSLKIYDLLGREVATLVNEERNAGNYEVQWNASNIPSGVYFYKLQAGDFVETKRMLMIK